MNDTLTPLEQQRLHELKHLVAVRALDVPSRYHRAGARRRHTRPAMALGTIAAAAVGAIFAFGGSGNHISAQLAGYSVHRADDGVVTITLTDYTDAGQLSSELKADGIPAVVYLIPLGQICREPGATQVNLKPDYSMPGGLYSLPGFLPGGGWTMQLNPSHLKPGQTFVFGITPGGPSQLHILPGVHPGKVTVTGGSSTYVASGHLASCQFIPAIPKSSPPPGVDWYVGGATIEFGSS